MGTETNSSRVVCPTLYVILVKLNNPLMGTETEVLPLKGLL